MHDKKNYAGLGLGLGRNLRPKVGFWRCLVTAQLDICTDKRHQ